MARHSAHRVIKIKIRIRIRILVRIPRIKFSNRQRPRIQELPLIFNLIKVCLEQINKKKIDHPNNYLILFLSPNNKIPQPNKPGNKVILKISRLKENSNCQSLKIKLKIRNNLQDNYKKKLIFRKILIPSLPLI